MPHVIGMDEFFPDKATPENADRHRREYIWPIYLSGGQLEFILDELLKTEDFRKYQDHWRYMWHARRFIEQHLPFWGMIPRDELLAMKIGKGEVFALPGEIYAVYLPNGGQATLDLTGCPGRFVRQWYNPRQGVFEGPAETLFGGKRIDLGVLPNKPSEDWTALLTLIKP